MCTNPIWVIKTRMLSTAANHNGAYISMIQGTRKVFQHEGVRGFYKGMLPSLFGVSHGAIQFMTYEQMKNHKRIKQPEGRGLENRDYLIFSGLSKILAGALTYPYQVIRSRLQAHGADTVYRGSRDVFEQILRKEGCCAFYKGLTLNLIRVVPSSCVTFLVYENVKTHLSQCSSVC